MEERRTLGEIDLVTTADVRVLATAHGPCVSVFMPTHRRGPETLQGPVRLRNLVDQAAAELRAADVSQTSIDELLVPLRTLIDEPKFWQHQGVGLALFASADQHAWFRLPTSVAEEVSVAPSFQVRPLIPLLSGGEAFFLLALSQNSVRLFEATAHTIGELERGTIPNSMSEALAHEDPERQLQVRSGGGGTAQFHGHGAGGEIDKAALERFFRRVDRGVVERLGPARAPLVLACVGYYVPIYRAVSRYPTVIESAVEGNPEHRSPEELHAAGWPLVEEPLAAQTERRVDPYRRATGTGTTTAVLQEVVSAAYEGRVDTLYVTQGPPRWGRVDAPSGKVMLSPERSLRDEDLVNRAVLETVVHDGEVVALQDALDPEGQVAALLRY